MQNDELDETQESLGEYSSIAVFFTMSQIMFDQVIDPGQEITELEVISSDSDWLADAAGVTADAWHNSLDFGTSLLSDVVGFGTDCYGIVAGGVSDTVHITAGVATDLVHDVGDVGEEIVHEVGDIAVATVDEVGNVGEAAGDAIGKTANSLLGNMFSGPMKWVLIAGVGVGGVLLYSKLKGNKVSIVGGVPNGGNN